MCQQNPTSTPGRDASCQLNTRGFAARRRGPRLRLDPARVPAFTGALLKFRLPTSYPPTKKAASKPLLFCCHARGDVPRFSPPVSPQDELDVMLGFQPNHVTAPSCHVLLLRQVALSSSASCPDCQHLC